MPLLTRLPFLAPKTLAAFLGLGGLLGIARILDSTPRGAAGLLDWFFWSIGILLMLLPIVAAILLARDSPDGRPLAILAFLLQVPHIQVPGLEYSCYTTAAIPVVWSTAGRLGVGLTWGSRLQLWFGGEADPAMIGVNLVACFALYAVFRMRSVGRAHVPGETTLPPPAG